MLLTLSISFPAVFQAEENGLVRSVFGEARRGERGFDDSRNSRLFRRTDSEMICIWQLIINPTGR